MNWKSYFSNFLQVIYELAAVFLIFKALLPVFAWYLSKSPAYGVDLFNSATHVSYYLRHFTLPFAGFRDIWFGGYPMILDPIQYAYYLIRPGPGCTSFCNVLSFLVCVCLLPAFF